MNPNQQAWQNIYNTLGNINKMLGEGITDSSGKVVMGGTPKTTAESNKSGSGGTTNANQSLLDYLTSRLETQGQGIVSSTTSNLQNALAGAMEDTQRSGDLTSQALQSEREREVSYAQDRAAAQYSTALESRTGFASMTYGLRELTETTEKSIRDLDKRYQEAILTNDAATAQRVSDLRVKQLEMQQEAEARYMDNLFKTASMQTQQNQWQSEYDLGVDKFNLDALASERGYELDKLKLAQDKDLAADELAFKYASLAQDRELAYAQINAANARAGDGKLTLEDRNLLDANIYTLLQQQLNSGTDVRKMDPITAAGLAAPLLNAAGWDIQALGGSQINAAVTKALKSIKENYQKSDPTFDYGVRAPKQSTPAYQGSFGQAYIDTYRSLFK